MAEVKCGRCDRRYSSLKSRCPYCGARRNKHGKHSNDENNSTAKLLVGIVILLLLIVAVVVLIVTSVKGDTAKKDSSTKAPVESKDSDISTVEGTDPTGGDTQTSGTEGDTQTSGTTDPDAATSGTEGETTTPGTTDPTNPTGGDTTSKVESVKIQYFGSTREDITLEVGEKLQLEVAVEPESASSETVKWESSDESVFVVLQTGELTGIGKGVAELKVTVGDKTATCIIRGQ